MPRDRTSRSAPSPVGWFEIATARGPSLEAFYGSVFGWEFEDNPHPDVGPDYRLIRTGDDACGGIRVLGGSDAGEPYMIVAVVVEDVAESCAMIEAHGGSVEAGPVVTPGGVERAIVRDLDGNLFGIFRPPD